MVGGRKYWYVLWNRYTGRVDRAFRRHMTQQRAAAENSIRHLRGMRYEWIREEEV